MLTLVVLFFATFAQFVLGQVVSPPPNTPPCLITCGLQYCPTGEMQCECVDQVSNITICVLANCSSSDVTLAGQIASQICGPNVTATVTSGTATATTTITSTSSTASSTPAGESASSAVQSASSALSSASVALSSVASTASAASHSASAAATSATSTSNAINIHTSAIGIALLGLAGIAAGFALL